MMSHWGIRAKVLLMALTPPTLIALCLGLFLVQTQITALEDSLIERGKTITELLASTCENGIFIENSEALQSLAENTVNKQIDVKYVSITSYNGRFSVQHSNPPLQNTLSQALVASMLKLFVRDEIPLIFE